MVIIHPARLIIAKIILDKGYAVFAKMKINEGSVVEICPTLFVLKGEVAPGYTFEWNEKYNLLCLGFGSLYNHSDTPNCKYELDGLRSMLFTATRNIDKDEELTVKYGATFPVDYVTALNKFLAIVERKACT